MSQMKIWKIVKKRREKQEAHRVAEERQQEKAELDLGRKLEEGNIQEKIRWEAVYGGRKQVDSGLSTNTTSTPRKTLSGAYGGEGSDKGSTESVTKKEANASDFRVREPARITVRVASEDSIYEVSPSTSNDLLSTERREQGLPQRSSVQANANEASRSQNFPKGKTKMPDVESQESSPETNERGFTPLPFNIGSEGTCIDDDRSSVATFAESDRFDGRTLMRLSGSGLLTDLSQHSRQKLSSSAHCKGQASSVAATGDDVGDDSSSRGNLSDPENDASPFEEGEADETGNLVPGDDVVPLTVENLEANKATSTNAPRASSILPEGFERLYNDDEALVNTDRGRGYLEQSLKPTSPPPAVPERSPTRVSVAKSEGSQERSGSNTLDAQLPEGASKVVMAYRTNEWAKHLEKAEAPAMDDLKRQPQHSNTDAITAEPTAPVHVRALQQTPLTAEPAPIKFKPSVQKPEVRQPATSRNSLPSQQKRPEQRTNLRRSSMGNLLDRSSSQVSLARRNHRGSSSPLAESPIDENVEMSFPKRMSTHPTNALIAHRSSTLQTGYSSNSLVRTNSASSLAPIHPQTLQNQGHDYIINTNRQSLRPQNSHRHSSRPNLTPRTSATLVSPTPPQHRETLAANWRSSLQQDPRASNEALSRELEGRQTDLLRQQRRASAGIQAAEMERYMRRENEVNRRMSSGDLLEAHQKVMRKMQGSVKH